MAVKVHDFCPPISTNPAAPVVSPPPAQQRQGYGLGSPLLQTANLRIRRWEGRDVQPFAIMCADPAVTQFFTGPMALMQCFQEIEWQEVCFDAYQYGIWVVELKATGEFIGCVGFDPTMMVPKGNTVRLTWKLRREFWGMGYAYEAAMEVMKYAFTQLEVAEVIAIVHPANIRSRQLVKRLGLAPKEKEPDCYYRSAL
jgi:RimJ/RimL family protein N-acetyltransferase